MKKNKKINKQKIAIFVIVFFVSLFFAKPIFAAVKVVFQLRISSTGAVLGTYETADECKRLLVNTNDRECLKNDGSTTFITATSVSATGNGTCVGLSIKLPGTCRMGCLDTNLTNFSEIVDGKCAKASGEHVDGFSCCVANTSVGNVVNPKEFQYTLLEGLPGFFNAGGVMTDFPALVLAIYKFGIWTIGISGMFMITIGGIMYAGSAGNTSTAGKAKEIIIDALIGIAAAMIAYLFLYVINPDLTQMNINFTAVNVDEITEGTPMGQTSKTGKCQSLSSGPCSVANLTPVFGVAATQASSICNGESDGIADRPSGVDVCMGNNTKDPVSFGLFQINLSAHNVGSLSCKDAFNVVYTATIARDKTKCWVINRDLYNKCVTAAKNAAINIATAKSIYMQGTKNTKQSWRPWGANKRANCNFP